MKTSKKVNKKKVDNNDLEAEMLADSGDKNVAVPKNETMTELAKLVLELQNKDLEVEVAEEKLKILKEEQRELSMYKIPDLFDTMSLSQLKMKDGSFIQIQRSFATSISEANKEACFAWLKKNKHDGIIKHDLTVKFKKGEEKENKDLIKTLTKIGLTYTDKE